MPADPQCLSGRVSTKEQAEVRTDLLQILYESSLAVHQSEQY